MNALLSIRRDDIKKKREIKNKSETDVEKINTNNAIM